MLDQLRAHNFKCFVDLDLSLKPLTVLTGKNGAGKSSVIEAILMLKRHYDEFGDGGLRLEGHAFPALLKTNLSKEDSFSLSVKKNNKEYATNLAYMRKGAYKFSSVRKGDKGALNNVVYLSASRLGPINSLPVDNVEMTADVGAKGESVIAFIEKNNYEKVPEKLRLRDTSETLRMNIDDWLDVITPGTKLDYEINLNAGIAVPSYTGILPTETGFGLSFTLPVLAMLLYFPGGHTNQILLLENPEAHLHPAAQTALGKLIAYAASEGKQVILETHSDHIIDGIRIATKQRRIKNTDIAFYYFSRKDFDSPAEVESPEIYENGKLSAWPKGFFDQGILDKAELLKNDD